MNSPTSFLLQSASGSVSYIMLSNIEMKFLILLAIFDPWLVHSNTEDANAWPAPDTLSLWFQFLCHKLSLAPDAISGQLVTSVSGAQDSRYNQA